MVSQALLREGSSLADLIRCELSSRVVYGATPVRAFLLLDDEERHEALTRHTEDEILKAAISKYGKNVCVCYYD
jgi:hypothetical protein